MKTKIGDTVRFLNISGGGIITRIDKKLVYVEDEDGFEIPMMPNEVVVVESAGANESVKKEAGSTSVTIEVDDDYDYVEDEASDDDPKFYLAFLQGDKQGEESGNTRAQIVNDSNYFASYVISRKFNDTEVFVVFNGTVEPNTKLALDSFVINQIDNQQWEVQLLLFKKNKAYAPLAPIQASIKIKAARFLKNNSYVDNDYYHEKAVLLPVIKGEMDLKMELLSDSDIAKVIQEKESKPIRKKYAKRNEPGILEVDLHIDELIDSTVGLSNGEMLQIQLDKFKSVIAENQKNKNRKLVFIHGVGGGVLKTEIRKLLDRQYKKHSYQDASFKEYGYGATMVIV